MTVPLIVLLVILDLAEMIAFTVLASLKDTQSKAQMAQVLGITPITKLDTALAEQILTLHRTPWGKTKFGLYNISRHLLLNGFSAR